MSFSPIAFTIPNYRDYSDWWLKAYEPGTTTPKNIALDSDGSTLVAKVQLNSDGFTVSAGSAFIIPFVSGSYDLWLFPTESEADANDTANALQFADNISGPVTAEFIDNLNPDSLSDAMSLTGLKEGDVLNIKERTTDNGGGAFWDAVDAVANPANGFDVVTSATSGVNLKLRITPIIDVLAFGIASDDSTDYTSTIQTMYDTVPDGTIIIWSAGKVSRNILIAPNPRIEITKSRIKNIGNGAIIKLAGGDYSSQSQIQGFYTSFKEGVIFESMEFNGNRANVVSPSLDSTLIWFDNSKNCQVTNCRVQDMFGGSASLNAPFAWINTSRYGVADNNTIENEIADDSFGLSGAIFMQGQNHSACGNKIKNVNDAAIVANGAGSRGFTFANNNLEGCFGGGIAAENGAKEVAITNNTILTLRDAYGIGVIYIGPVGDLSDRVTIVGNVISGNVGTGVCNPIAVLTGNNVTVSGNTISNISTDNAQNTLVNLTSINCSVTCNILQGGVNGVRLNECVGVQVAENTINTQTSGVELQGNLIDCDINSNTLRDMNTGINAVAGYNPTRLSVTYNRIDALVKQYALGNTTNIELKVLTNIDYFTGEFTLPAPVNVPAGSYVQVAADLGVASEIGGPMDTNVSYVEAVSNNTVIVMNPAGFIAGGVTAVWQAYNFDTSAASVSSIKYRAYGTVNNYQK